MNGNEEFKKLSEAIKELLQNKGLEDKIRKAKVLSMWKDIVGPHIANNTFNMRFEGNKLLVNVKSDALKNELMFMRHQIIQNIHQTLKEEFIEDIIFY